MESSLVLWLLLFPSLLYISGYSVALDLHIDGAVESSFFFQQSLGSSQQPLLRFPQHSSSNDSKPLLRERLAVLGPSVHPASVRVTYGPFEARQSLPARFLSVNLDNSTEEESLDHAVQMDITAHVVNSELRRESPVLRVLFHSGRHFHPPAEEDDDKEDESRLMETCIALKVQNPANIAMGPLTATCTPQGLDGVCLASLTLPFDWWTSSPISSPTFPSLQQPPATAKPTKAVRNAIDLSYSVYETKSGHCSGGGKKMMTASASFPPPSAVLIQSSRPIGAVKLLPNVYAPRDLLVHEEAISLSPTLRFIASAAPLYPHSHFYVTVLLDSTSVRDEPYAVVIRAKVKHGLKIISTQTTNPAWGLTFDVNGKHIAAAVTAVRNFSVSALNNHQSSSQELFTWLLAVNVDNHKDSSEIGPDGGVRALWSWTIRSHSTSPAPISSHHHHHGVKEGLDEVKGKLTSRFEVLKDEVQSVFPIIKRRDLVNTAILTSRQVSEPLRVFMVTQAGKVADVTLQASCSSADESVLKVSSSCTSVYLDGSEVRGSTNATLIARYGNVETSSSLTVWVPELPLDIQMNDIKLNQIGGWKVPVASSGSSQCRMRYQQTSFEVYARFYAEDHDSGRVSYLVSRKTYLLITDLVRKVIRVSDPRIASLRTSGTLYVEGMKPGKTELQVLSPMSGHVIAAREVRVAAEKVEVTGLSIRPIAGLTLSLTPDADLDSCFIAQVDAQERLLSKYQEAILDITAHFSDGQSLALRLVDRFHYSLTVESYNTSILALTSPLKASIPRVLALNEGLASLFVVFSSSPTCNQEEVPIHPLASSRAVVNVTLAGHSNSPVQNDARTESSQSYVFPSGNQIIADMKRSSGKSSGRGASQHNQAGQGQLTFSEPGSADFGSVGENQLSLKDDSNAVVMTGRGADQPYSSHHPPGSSYIGNGGMVYGYWHMSPLEIGMYVLLAVFCAAIAVFVGTCAVYASRARKFPQPELPPQPTPPTVNPETPTRSRFWKRLIKMGPDPEEGVYDLDKEEERTDKGWIWLGRSTLDTEPVTEPLGARKNRPVETEQEISTKRMSGISYCGSEVSVRITSRPDGREGFEAELCFDPEPTNIVEVNSSTFTKNNPIRITSNQLAEDPALILSKVVRRTKNRRSGRRLSDDQQDTRRYARSWLMAGEAVPRDFNSNPSTLNGVQEPGEDEEELIHAETNSAAVQDQQPQGYNLATFLRHGSPDIKQANIVENPRFSTASPVGEMDQENNSLLQQDEPAADGNESSVNNNPVNNQLAIDYDRIISYLGILKETST